MSRKELAERAGMRSEAGVRDIEQGLSLPRWDTVVALCAVLGVKPDEFQQEPSPREPDKGGRPPKAPDPVEEVPKRRRGRPRGETKKKGTK